jgi:hypothetical protein
MSCTSKGATEGAAEALAEGAAEVLGAALGVADGSALGRALGAALGRVEADVRALGALDRFAEADVDGATLADAAVTTSGPGGATIVRYAKYPPPANTRPETASQPRALLRSLRSAVVLVACRGEASVSSSFELDSRLVFTSSTGIVGPKALLLAAAVSS